MTEVVRSVREIQEVTYKVSPDAVRGAILGLVYDNYSGVWTSETRLELTPEGGAVIVTPFAKEV